MREAMQEASEAGPKKRRPRTCSVCGKANHNRRTCPDKDLVLQDDASDVECEDDEPLLPEGDEQGGDRPEAQLGDGLLVGECNTASVPGAKAAADAELVLNAANGAGTGSADAGAQDGHVNLGDGEGDSSGTRNAGSPGPDAGSRGDGGCGGDGDGGGGDGGKKVGKAVAPAVWDGKGKGKQAEGREGPNEEEEWTKARQLRLASEARQSQEEAMLSEEDLKEVHWLAERIRERAKPQPACVCFSLLGKPCVCGCVVPPTMPGAVGTFERRAAVAIGKPGVLQAVRRLGEMENAGGLALAEELRCLYQHMAAKAREAWVASVGASGPGTQGALLEAEEPAKRTVGAHGQGCREHPRFCRTGSCRRSRLAAESWGRHLQMLSRVLCSRLRWRRSCQSRRVAVEQRRRDAIRAGSLLRRRQLRPGWRRCMIYRNDSRPGEPTTSPWPVRLLFATTCAPPLPLLYCGAPIPMLYCGAPLSPQYCRAPLPLP
jgi:hypothetical protein